ncbi:peptidoglycan-binding protein [Streptomyces sp. NPDC005805]|uniref:peptidoglycan-binding protein n=1 Tax=Streptomyces sp. NPDC005805 TaxID=3157068 RepID=UPI0033C63509
MGEWRGLPEGLTGGERDFVGELRRLKEISGLSLSALAGRTSVSRSSWDRYLNGRGLPPVDAVRELAELGGEAPERLLALRATADEARAARQVPGRARTDGVHGVPTGARSPALGPAPAAPPPEAAPARQPEPTPGATVLPGTGPDPAGTPATGTVPEPAPGGATTNEAPSASEPVPAAADAAGPGSEAGPGARAVRRRRAGLLAAAAALVAVALAALLMLPDRAQPDTDGSRPARSTEFVFEPGRTYSCDVRREDDRLYAGMSDTMDALLQQISTSWHVVEVQCLLEHRGYSPGGVDGAYGQATEKAVKRLQESEGLVPDGIVGPHTWEVLRR